MYKLAIFDMDGTLLDTLTDIAASCNYALSGCGFPVHEIHEYRDFLGRGVLNLILNALPPSARDDVTVKKVRALFDEHYAIHSLDFTKPYEGVVDMLKTLATSGIDRAVCSNKPHDNAISLSEIYFPGLIGLTLGSLDGAPIKPDTSACFRIIKHFGVDLKDTVYIGDSEIDMQTGKNLGVYTVGVSWGFRPKKELWDNGADVIVDKTDDLFKIIIDK